MARKVIYWVTTGLLAALSALAGISYLAGSAQVVHGFAHLGYPQHLRILLGIAKFLGAIALIVPGFPKLQEWAYAGFTFAWIAAHVAHHVAKDGSEQYLPLLLLLFLFISYITREASGKSEAKPAAA